LHLSEHHGDGSPGAKVIVTTSGIKDLHSELAAKGYAYMNPWLETQAWGTEVAVIDPSGNHIVFTEPPAKTL